MYSKGDKYRVYKEDQSELGPEEYRTEWRRDFARLIHSPCFRRLQGKTQLFPTQETDFFRNRLTHSLEVAQIAKSIAIKLNNTTLKNSKYQINEDICEFAGLAHDLGHPPFGHQGEEALDECMRDCGGFEGNAQTLRILSKVEKKIVPREQDPDNFISNLGLNLTMRSLASILKYDNEIDILNEDRPREWQNKAMKGYYSSEKDLVDTIKRKIHNDDQTEISKFKTVECQIMDIADDIAYSTYDLEDGLKASFMEPLDIIFASDDVIERTSKKVNKTLDETLETLDVKDILFNTFNQIFEVDQDEIVEGLSKHDYAVTLASIAYQTSKRLSTDGFYRTQFTSRQIGEAIRNVKIKVNEKYPALSEIILNKDLRIKIEILKHFVYESQIDSPKLKISEYRGKEIVKEIFTVLNKNSGFKLLPADYQFLYMHVEGSNNKKRVLADFISGMTDRYCSEFYYRIKSENPKTIFKPF